MIDFNNVKVENFFTDIYRASFLSSNYRSYDNYTWFERGSNGVSFFNKEYLFDDKRRKEVFSMYSDIKYYNLNKDDYLKFKKMKLKHNVMGVHITVLKFDEDIITLPGKQYSKIRYYRNYFNKKYNFEILDYPKDVGDVELFIREWKEIRKDSHFQFFIGYDINFWKNLYDKWKDRLISRFVYDGDKLIGYFICERVNKYLYNQLYRKVNTNYSHLSLYLDLINFQTIYNQINEPFLVNMEGDVGEDGLKQYKTENFPIFKVFETFDVKINNTVDASKLIDIEKPNDKEYQKEIKSNTEKEMLIKKEKEKTIVKFVDTNVNVDKERKRYIEKTQKQKFNFKKANELF